MDVHMKCSIDVANLPSASSPFFWNFDIQSEALIQVHNESTESLINTHSTFNPV